MLDLESEVMRGPGAIPTGGNIFHWIFFSHSEVPMPILALLPMLCVCENPECASSSQTSVRNSQRSYSGNMEMHLTAVPIKYLAINLPMFSFNYFQFATIGIRNTAHLKGSSL